MRKHKAARRSLSTLLAISLLGLLAVAAKSDTGPLNRNADTKKLCYCGCDAQHGAKMCEHMCELAKYQDRSWAANCHKPTPEKQQPTAHTPYGHSKKNNRNQQARL